MEVSPTLVFAFKREVMFSDYQNQLQDTMEGLLFFLIGLQGALGANLLEFGVTREQVVCCDDSTYLLCESVNINIDTLGEEELDLPYNIKVQFSNMIPGDNIGYHYMGNDAEAVLTFNPETNGLFGHVSTDDGRSFVIENCGKAGHVFKEIDLSKLGEDVGVEAHPAESAPRSNNQNSSNSSSRQGIPTYSVKVYYTPEFAEAVPDIEGFINLAITETNQGYMNSGVNLRVKLHCAEMATLHDDNDYSQLLRNFIDMKEDFDNLFGSADTATLLTAKKGYNDRVCGIAYIDTIDNGLTVSVVARDCAVGYYSFGHEIGHNIGLGHNRDVAENSYYSYGHGHLIDAGNAGQGFRTILAYYARGHWARQNFYSNPRMNHPRTGTPLGVEGLADNARLLNEKAELLASLRDESLSC